MQNGLVRRAGIPAMLAAVALLGSGCYHTIITTDLAPSTEVVHEGWKPAWIAGLVPAQVDGGKFCEGRKWARVETQQSFANWFVAALTAGIFTPMDVKVTCAAAGAMLPTDSPTLKLGAAPTEEETTAALAVARDLALESGVAVYVAF